MAGTTIHGASLSTTSSDRRHSFDQQPLIPPVAQNFNNQDVFQDRKVAPSPRAVCAELAHQHAFEDLEKSLQHLPGKKDLAGSA
ncbi:hypothetical protein N7510_003406 [Penicillium lagena]|uniref:uncharacterized protein n=1 Tax=Penicillium lagena TaxID=94218 RepID=UPI002540E011|nr:uncharacterized protein N7510_003406 [Penicillium lagena]KAJ5619422.1 hypothetical protein N7510_003406 [Penicillium lagena]